eukprot:6439357-Pyramimonas_sp.AAC.1
MLSIRCVGQCPKASQRMCSAAMVSSPMSDTCPNARGAIPVCPTDVVDGKVQAAWRNCAPVIAGSAVQCSASRGTCKLGSP